MTDIHASVGHIILTGKITPGFADSDDPGDTPDTIPGVADITISASVPRVVVTADKSVIPLVPVKATLNAAGQLVAPADGVGTTGTSTAVTLVAPNQDSIVPNGWQWKASVVPAGGQSWEPFEVVFDGEPGDSTSIGEALVNGGPGALGALFVAAKVIHGTGADGAAVAPGDFAGVPVGSLVINVETDPHTYGIWTG